MASKKHPLTFFTDREKIEKLTEKAEEAGISRSAYINSILYQALD
jgi:hypothetical protein